MSLPDVSEKSGIPRSGIDGSETDGSDGIEGNMSRADLVMLSMVLAGGFSSAPTRLPLAIRAAATKARPSFILSSPHRLSAKL
jgi:hypothetical protein